MRLLFTRHSPTRHSLTRMSLTPELLLYGYAQGIFPMAHDDGQIYWYDPDPRAILPLDAFHAPRSLVRLVRRGAFEIRVNSSFTAVITACAQLRPDREETWISPAIVTAYSRLHELGFAHSVEAWRDGRLVGGLYGVAIGGLFAGESMFSDARDASKVALVHLVERLKRRDFQLLDVQFMTAHLARFGAVAIPRAQYRARLAQALPVETQFEPAGGSE
jgi:leucyl/phenylalanyl-tRNA---protein transferase